MLEPEIALPPHTQRRIANYLLEKTNQCIVTSHSPCVLERFSPEQIQVLRQDSNGTLTGIEVPGSDVLNGKIYRKHARRGLPGAAVTPDYTSVLGGRADKEAVLERHLA